MSPRPFAILLVTAAALSGCAGRDAPRDISVAAVADATHAADSARVRFDVDYSGGGPSTVGEGVVDFRSGDSRLETSSGAGDDKAVTITANGVSFLGPKKDTGKGPSWIRLPTPDAHETQALAGPSLSPGLLVDELKGSATDVREAGSAKIHGDSTTTYRLDLRSGSRVLPLMVIPPKEPVVATIDVDDQGRLRRLVVKPDKPRGATDGDDVVGSLPVPVQSTLELWDFGVGVEVVAPDSSRVIEFDDPRAGDLLSRLFDGAGLSPAESGTSPDLEEPKLSGPFAKVAGGSWEEVAWAVWEAPTSDGRVCHTFELAPPPASDSLAGGPIPGVIEHDGHSASCGPPADLFRRGDPVQTFGTQYADAGYWYMAGTVAPEISALEVELADGRTLRVQVDGQSRVFTLFNRGVLDVKEIRPDAGGKASITCAVEEDELRPGLLNCSGTVHR